MKKQIKFVVCLAFALVMSFVFTIDISSGQSNYAICHGCPSGGCYVASVPGDEISCLASGCYCYCIIEWRGPDGAPHSLLTTFNCYN